MKCPACHTEMYPVPGTSGKWFICYDLDCDNFNRYQIEGLNFDTQPTDTPTSQGERRSGFTTFQSTGAGPACAG
jgi:hypothetical protein